MPQAAYLYCIRRLLYNPAQLLHSEIERVDQGNSCFRLFYLMVEMIWIQQLQKANPHPLFKVGGSAVADPRLPPIIGPSLRAKRSNLDLHISLDVEIAASFALRLTPRNDVYRRLTAFNNQTTIKNASHFC